MRNWVLVAYALAIGCGDNSRSCGTGTKVEDGVCVPSTTCGPRTIADEETGECVPDGTHVCTDGTRFDMVSGSCQIDPSACQNGTVLVGDECVDPTTGMLVDLEEGPEPNGLGVVEDSTAPAGVFFVKPSGTYVVHGRITPHGDAPDVDAYRMIVNEGCLLEISTDGVGGLAAGFAFSYPLWRLGVDLGSDTSKRLVYAPAGVYTLAVGDMRTMLELDGDVPDPNGMGEYYLAVTPHPLPAPSEVLVPSTTVATLAPGDVAFFHTTFPMMHPAGWYRVTVDMPADLAVGAVSMPGLGNGYAVEANGAPAEVTQPMYGSVLIVVDSVVSLAPGPVDFTLTVEPTVPDPDQ